MQDTPPEYTPKINKDEVCNKHMKYLVHKKKIRKVVCKKHTNKEFKFNTEIGNFDMNSVLLDLGYNVNILPNRTWE